MVMENEQTGKPNKNSEPVSSYDVPGGEQLKNELASDSALADRVESANNNLPYVDDSQESECPFTEQLYAQKEKLEQELKSKVEVLKRYHKVLSSKVDRCREILQEIQVDSAKLKLQETSKHYSQALEAQQSQYDSAVDNRDAVSVVLKKAQAILNVSRSRKYPGKTLDEQFPFPAGMPGPLASAAQTPDPQSPAGGLSNEISGLISMGPLEQTEG